MAAMGLDGAGMNIPSLPAVLLVKAAWYRVHGYYEGFWGLRGACRELLEPERDLVSI